MKFWSLLSLSILLALPALAQPEAADYRSEITLSGGIAPMPVPFHTYYDGEDVKLPYYAAFNYHYNVNEAFQVGFGVGMTHWETSEDQYINTISNASLADQEITYIFADRAIDVTARANWVFPTYNSYRQNASNAYVGAALGAVFTVNTYGQHFAQAGDRQGPDYRYLRQYNYNSGAGIVAGLQAGYTRYFFTGVGLNAEVAARYTYIKTNNADLEANNENFGVLYFPLTLGIRIRL